MRRRKRSSELIGDAEYSLDGSERRMVSWWGRQDQYLLTGSDRHCVARIAATRCRV
jgi:hypothetical protein